MKKKAFVSLAAVLLMLALVLTSCTKSEFSGNADANGKKITFTAENAAKDDFVMTGALEIAEGEQIVITSNLTKGLVHVELFKETEEQSIDELPEVGGDPLITANLGGPEHENKTESISGSAPAGSYMVKATCDEETSGTVQVEAKKP